ncbi:MAG: ankyrin repeat domain-containing protein [Phycisphaerales bacterium]|nr:ankyrin repeat domain-containing protein [Phycisphaerales bacterium]
MGLIRTTAFFATFCMLTASSSFAQGIGPAPTPPKPLGGAAPVVEAQVITVTPDAIELGEFSTSETKPGTVTLKNTSAENVTVVSAKASCGCTTADFKRNTVLGPGEEVDVTIRLRGGPTARELNKTVTFTIEGYPQLKVPVRGTSVSYVTMAPDRIGQDENPDGEITLESIDGQPFKIVNVQPNILKETPEGASEKHVVQIDWDKFWNVANNAKVSFFFDHPRCTQHYFLVKLNPEQRAEINRRIRETGRKGNDPVKGAAAKGQPSRANAEVDVRVLVKQARLEELMKRIEEKKVNVNQQDKSGMSLVGMAAKEGNDTMIVALIEAGADYDASDNVGRTPLMHAGTSKKPKATRALIDAGADVNKQDTFIGGPLAWTSGFGQAESVQDLVDAGAQVETVGAATGYTPLIWASGFGDPESVPILIEAGANIEAQDTIDGGTPLIHASRTGSAVGLKSLLDSGASIEAKDRNGKTALLAAAGHSGGSTEKLILLMDAGSDLSASDNAGRSALVLAQARTDDDAAAVIALLKERMPESE